MKKFILTILIVFMTISVFAKKNVILMIGDGMGINSVRMAQQYMGKDFPFTKWDTKCFMTTYSLNCPDGYDPSKAWLDPVKAIPNFEWLANVTDSGAAATALNSGIKTQNGKINMSKDGKRMYVPFGQAMKAAGYAVGSISTVTWNDATPSGPIGHTAFRGDNAVMYDMLITNPIDVLGGTGNPYYNNNGVERASIDKKKSPGLFGEANLFNKLEKGELEYKLCATSDSIRDVAKLKNPTGKYFFSLPSTGDLPYMKMGELSKNQYIGCPDNIITLSEMSESALNVLKENDKGFYLMIESGAIDHGNHGNNWEHSVCQTAALAEAVETVTKWVEKNSSWDETLLIITADHQTGGITNSDGTYWVTGNGKGKKPNLKYANGGHTNLPVPVFVKGSYAKNIYSHIKGLDPVLGKYIDNTDIAPFMGEWMGIKMPMPTTYNPVINFKLPTLSDRIKDLKQDQIQISQDFAFLPDEEAKGLEKKWNSDFSVYNNAKTISSLKDWNSQGYDYSSGEGWYYQKIKVPQEYMNKKYIYFYVIAADEEAWIYVNGQLAKDHSINTTGKTALELWTKPFFCDLKKYGSGNEFDVVVRVGNEVLGGGLYSGVRLYASDLELFE